MSETYDLVISGGVLATHETSGAAAIGVRAGRIAAIGDIAPSQGAEHIDAAGLTILPGVIDTQVHFREPGLTHKEDLESGSLCAVMGGVVGVFEMPNTKPPTTDLPALQNKLKAAHHRMHCDFAFYVGATPENATTLPELEKQEGVCGVKVFMGSSTGQLLVPDDESLGAVIANITRRAAFHSEDEFRLRERRPLAETGKVETHPVWRDVETAVSSTKRLLAIARKHNKQIHVLHITTADEMKLLADNRDIATVEVTPQHLTLAAPDCYERLGTHAQMNPPIRGGEHREALWAALDAGIVDVIGSDHAPHTAEEKAEAYPHSPAGMPGVQTLLPLMLNHHNEGRLSLQRLVELTSTNARKLFKLKDKGIVEVGAHADFTFVDLKREETIKESWLASRCGWSPFTDMRVKGWATGTMIRGTRVMWEGELTTPNKGEAIKFN